MKNYSIRSIRFVRFKTSVTLCLRKAYKIEESMHLHRLFHNIFLWIQRRNRIWKFDLMFGTDVTLGISFSSIPNDSFRTHTFLSDLIDCNCKNHCLWLKIWKLTLSDRSNVSSRFASTRLHQWQAIRSLLWFGALHSPARRRRQSRSS